MINIIQLIISIFLGIISGLIPGIHPNLISSIMLDIIPSNSLIPALSIMLGVASVLAFYPSVFFGMPDDPTMISMLPGYNLYLKGKGLITLKIINQAILFSLIISILILPLTTVVYPLLYAKIEQFIGIILILAMLRLFWGEKRLLPAIIISIMAGALGYFTFNNSSQPLLVLFTGLFAMSSIYISWDNRSHPIKQQHPDESNTEIHIGTNILGIFGGFIADLLPGIASPAQVAIIFSPFLNGKPIRYIEFISSMVVSHIVFAYSTSMTIGKARVGVISMMSVVTYENVLMGLAFFSIGIAIGVLILEFLIKITDRMNFNMNQFNLGVGVFLPILIFYMTGSYGLFLFACASALGVGAILLKVKRVYLMNALVLPLIIYYLFGR